MTDVATKVMQVPEWDLGDRMRKSQKTAGVSTQEMADYLGVARETVSTWVSGRITPSKQTLMLWALKTGTPYEWVATGCTPPDLNREPTDSRSGVIAMFPIAQAPTVDAIVSIFPVQPDLAKVA